MRIASIATVAFALLCTMGAARAAEPLSGERVLASQLRLSARLIVEFDGRPARRSPNIVISPASIAGILSPLDIGADTKMHGAIFTTLGLRQVIGHEPAIELAAFRATMTKAAMDANTDANLDANLDANTGAHRGKASFVLANAFVLDPQSRRYAKALAGMRATGVITTLESAEPRKKIETLVVDRPFLFGLRDTRSGLLLMSGYIGRPSTDTAAAREDSTRQFATLPSNRMKE